MLHLSQLSAIKKDWIRRNIFTHWYGEWNHTLHIIGILSQTSKAEGEMFLQSAVFFSSEVWVVSWMPLNFRRQPVSLIARGVKLDSEECKWVRRAGTLNIFREHCSVFGLQALIITSSFRAATELDMGFRVLPSDGGSFWQLLPYLLMSLGSEFPAPCEHWYFSSFPSVLLKPRGFFPCTSIVLHE